MKTFASRTIKTIVKYGFPLVIVCFACGFSVNIEKIPNNGKHYGNISNNVSQGSGPEDKTGSPLNGIQKIGFFCLGGVPSFDGDMARQINFLRWMKERLEKVGHVIFLDLANGIDFTGIANGGSAIIQNRAVSIYDFKAGNITIVKDVVQLDLTVYSIIQIHDTKKTSPHEPIWKQEFLVDTSDKDNLEIGYKDLIENLIEDLANSNLKYRKSPVFYLYIDTEHEPELKKAFGRYVSPPLTTIQESVVHLQDK
ncbi:hypothetical protein [Simkania negevensis]|uniref:Uncharacterized protein n=1 Tax=Simkania negevensis (strain ATCC VR-1471 / DSM 27360 / Z) TaxID=331113 RepID=F8L313_SIMNZ|nr:hypothetical protein [Simkania negevensis]CCB87859.1 unknown protein [Simkania negevensis Z]